MAAGTSSMMSSPQDPEVETTQNTPDEDPGGALVHYRSSGARPLATTGI